MNSKIVFAVLACCLLLFAPIAVADMYTGSIRAVYSSGWNNYPIPNADIYKDNIYMGKTDSKGYLYFPMNSANMGMHTFSGAGKVGSVYYYCDRHIANVLPNTKDFWMVFSPRR